MLLVERSVVKHIQGREGFLRRFNYEDCGFTVPVRVRKQDG